MEDVVVVHLFYLVGAFVGCGVKEDLFAREGLALFAEDLFEVVEEVGGGFFVGEDEEVDGGRGLLQGGGDNGTGRTEEIAKVEVACGGDAGAYGPELGVILVCLEYLHFYLLRIGVFTANFRGWIRGLRELFY
jgi:hypothetical protein